MKDRIVNSVSSGYSSVMMAIMMKDWYPDAEIVNIMVNTSMEREESLEFMDKCDKLYGLDLVWVEAEIHPEKMKGTDFVVKTFETLTRDGSIFEKAIQKYGIPSQTNKWCNRELKLRPIHKYIKSIGWGSFGKYKTAIGYRIDEIDRFQSKEIRDGYQIFYPLVEHDVDSRLRNKFWSNQPIKLSIPAYMGNCTMCWKKSVRKLATIYREEPHLIDWWLDMENKYSSIQLPDSPSYNNFIERDGGHYSLRGNSSYKTILQASKNKKLRSATDEYVYENDLFDQEDECGSGCNIFSSLFQETL